MHCGRSEAVEVVEGGFQIFNTKVNHFGLDMEAGGSILRTGLLFIWLFHC